jgi:hypothetical protein
MATLYPGALDTVTQLKNDAVDGTITLTTHKTHHNNISDAIIAIETELGVNPSGSFSDVTAALAQLDPSSGGVVVKTPGADQIILPSADKINIALRAFGAGQTSKLLEFRDSTGAVVASFDKIGVHSGPATLTGTPTAPTAAPGTNTTQIASTAFVAAAVAGIVSTRTAAYPVSLRNAQQNANPGNAAPNITAFTSYEGAYWLMLKDVDSHVYGSVYVPENLAGTPAAKIVIDVMANATSGVTRMGVLTKGVADGVTMDPSSLTAETEQDITVPGTVYFRKKITFTLTTPPTAGQLMIVDVYHHGAHANDTLAVDTFLLGARLVCDVT